MLVFTDAPLDLENHPQRALECAITIREWSESFRRRAPAAAIEFGRMRIGIETGTGTAVVGDVGIQSKLDYTAHGDAVNMAARLEACNKELLRSCGSTGWVKARPSPMARKAPPIFTS